MFFLKNSKLVYIFVLASLILLLTGCSFLQANSDSPYKDLPPTHWAYDIVLWGVEKGIINGYPDGTVYPDRSVSESEFLAMLFRTFADKKEENTTGDWAVQYYNKAEELNWQVWGRGSRYELMDRVHMAVIVSNALGYNLSEDGSIQTLLNLGVVDGKIPGSIDGYGTGEVTRAEALKVMKTLVDKGTTELKSKPIMKSEGPVIKSEFLKKMLPLVQFGEQKGYQVRMNAMARETGFSLDNEGIIFLTYRSVQSSDNQLVLYKANSKEQRLFASELLYELGIGQSTNLEEEMEQVRQSRVGKVITEGSWELYISPGNVDEYIQINFRKKT